MKAHSDALRTLRRATKRLMTVLGERKYCQANSAAAV